MCFDIGHNLSLICQLTSEDIKRHFIIIITESIARVQELCENRGGRPGLSVLMSLTVSVDVKQHFNNNLIVRAQELCESRGGRPC